MLRNTVKSGEEILEESVLLVVDSVAEQAKDQTTKMIADLFKSALLKKYKDAFDQELMQGSVHMKNIDKAVDFCYADICVSIRQLPGLNDEKKESMIQEGKQMKNQVKMTVERILENKGIDIIQ